MRGKAARNLWGKEDSPGQNAKTVAAERRPRAAADRNKTAEASQEAEAEQQTITSKKGFLAGLVNDVFYIEKTIPDTFPEENSVPLLPKNAEKKAAPPTEGSGPFVEAVSKARKPPAQKTRRTMARTAPMLKPVSAKGERKSQSEAAPLEATQSGAAIEPKRARRALSPALRKTLLVTTLLLFLPML